MKTITKIIFCILISKCNLFAQKYIYFNRNEDLKILFVSFTDDINKVAELHRNGNINATKTWRNHNIEHFETVEDKSEATYFVSTLDEGRLQIPKGYTLISDIKDNQDIDEMLDRLNKKANTQVKYNQYQGDLTERQVEDVIKEFSPNTPLIKQVCLKNEKGMTFIDIAYIDKSNNLILLEVKSSSNAYKRYLSSNQKSVHYEIGTNGGELCSNDDDVREFFKKYLGIDKGERINPTKVIPVIYN